MRFESKQLLNWLWLAPLLWIFSWIVLKAAQKKLEKAFGQRMTPFLTASFSSGKKKIKIILQIAVLCLFVIALARPQAGSSKQAVKAEGIEIVLVVDVSNSMMAEDMRPNRLEQVKVEMGRLIEQLPGHKIGIIAFAGSAAVLSPLTTDPNALKLYLDSLSPLTVSTQGTSFKDALSAAKEVLDRGGVGKEQEIKVTRAILVASDGEDQEPGALDAAKKLVDEGIRIFTLAYGTEKGAPIPERDNMGFLRGYKKDAKGQTVLSSVNGNALRDLAQAGHGSFYHAAVGGDHIKNVVEDINKLEKSTFESEMQIQYEEKFQWVLLVGILLALLEFYLGERRGNFRLWTGRFEVPPG